MKFNLNRRTAEFGSFNNRTEKHGKEKRVPAIDLPVKLSLSLQDMDIVVLSSTDEDPEFSVAVFAEDEERLIYPHIFPLKVGRKPEGLAVTIFDKDIPGTTKGSKKAKGKKIDALEFTDGKAKDIVVDAKSGPNITVSFKLQLHPTAEQWKRVVAIQEGKRDIVIEAQQEELFAEPEPEGSQAPAGGDDDDDE